MKTQISRDSFQPAKRYSGIQQQQGRMLTDADWNELVALCGEQLAQALKDVIGSGSPRVGAVSVTADRKIQPGELYVDGIRAQLPGKSPLAANSQPDLPGYPALPATGPYIVYADVWDRAVTFLEDPSLRDPGLHGADTCTRTQTMLQVKVCPSTVNPETGLAHQGNATLSLALHASMEAGDLCDPCAGLISAGKGRVGSYLFRLEVHAVEGSATNPTRLILKWSSENGAEQYEALPIEQMPPGFVASDFVYEFHNIMTEKHVGLFVGTGFTPTHGALATSYVVPGSPPKEWARRWDGFCELTRSGLTWSLVTGRDRGVVLTTGGSASAPGHVTLGSSIQINLEALRLTLDLTGKTFLAGDFWLAPVREAVHGPGSSVLSAAEPRGITHHYLRLAQVLADGSVVPFENDADKRQHSFPPLTDLHAHDVGYQTTCASGLFDATHDNVEKALNRLCELAAEHVAYTADCAKGLYEGFSGTVKQALDLICSIQAGDVGFTKPCDTSIYQGKTVATVQEALTLLCNIQAGQISYSPGGACTFLNQPGIDTVQEALDALCARPSGGGCKITVGTEGVFRTLEEALKTLIEKRIREICLCLLAEEHVLVGQPFVATVAGQRISISGCGPATRLRIGKERTRFEGFEALSISNLEIVTEGAAAGALQLTHCGQIDLRQLAILGLVTAKEGALVEVSGGRSVALHDLSLEASGPESLVIPAGLLGLEPGMADLFRRVEPAAFGKMAREVAASLAKLPGGARRELATAVSRRVEDAMARLALRELTSYQELIDVLNLEAPAASRFLSVLREIRAEAVRVRPTVALSVVDAEADWVLNDCDLLGLMTLYGRSPAGPFPAGLPQNLREIVANVTFAGVTTIRFSGCRLTRIDVSVEVLNQLELIVKNKKGALRGLFRTGMLNECTLIAEENHLAFVGAHLTSTVFETVGAVVAQIIGDSSIYVGNQGGPKTILRNITPAGRSVSAANLDLDIQG